MAYSTAYLTLLSVAAALVFEIHIMFVSAVLTFRTVWLMSSVAILILDNKYIMSVAAVHHIHVLMCVRKKVRPSIIEIKGTVATNLSES